MTDVTDVVPVETTEQKALRLKAEGNQKYSAKEYDDAIALYTQAIVAHPRCEFYGNRAAAYIATNKFTDALADCLTALEMDDTFRKAYIRGVKCYTELQQLDDAQQLAQRGLEKFKNDKDLKQGYDRVNIIRNKLQRIEQKLTSISLKYDAMYESHLNDTQSPQSSSSSSSSTPTKGDGDGDEDMKEKSSEEEKSSMPPAIAHKLNEQEQREIDIAISMIDSLLRSDLSQSVALKATKIRALLIKQDCEGALSAATNTLRFNKDNIQVTKLRAIALFRNGSTDSAIKHLQQILRKDPDNKEIKKLFKLFKSIGRAKVAANDAFKSNDLALALTRYTECMAFDRSNHKFNCILYANRSAVWLKQKEWQNAYDDASVAIELDETYVKAYGRRLQALYGLDRYDEAVGDAERALALDPSSDDLKLQLREAKIQLKRSKKKDYYKILGVDKDATETEIKKGFRKMAMIYHPDKFASGSDDEQKNAEEKFKEIGEAYEVLKDPKLKQRYDSGVDPDQLKSGGCGGMPGGGVDISHIFDLLGGMNGGGHGHGHGGMPGGFPFSSGQQRPGQSYTFRFG
eukprot:CAMPEP_0202688652 /NCGR_PEP_ID=MMETSP1385-20130828/4130_1 /ASSEMBLY_ACC=CAM_ASM_000861 /TAXON_ID=933848 /ORGANISM="Elphidium margaritaceum" /LENGTH=571 /DNA_ID=CAMNT_0049343671 /DNA_START=47 /DNA_END=1762 /DNA_ORIENTATION=+